MAPPYHPLSAMVLVAVAPTVACDSPLAGERTTESGVFGEHQLQVEVGWRGVHRGVVRESGMAVLFDSPHDEWSVWYSVRSVGSEGRHARDIRGGIRRTIHCAGEAECTNLYKSRELELCGDRDSIAFRMFPDDPWTMMQLVSGWWVVGEPIADRECSDALSPDQTRR